MKKDCRPPGKSQVAISRKIRAALSLKAGGLVFYEAWASALRAALV